MPVLLSALALSAATAGGTRVTMPVPVHPSGHPITTTVWGGDLDVPTTTVDDGHWRVRCAATDGRYRLSLEVVATYIPRKRPKLRCEGKKTWLQVRPMVAYDAKDDPRDGVSVVKRARGMMYFETDLPDGMGTMEDGECAVLTAPRKEGTTVTRFVLRAVRPLRSGQVCTLSFVEGGTLDVPIRVVRDPALLGGG